MRFLQSNVGSGKLKFYLRVLRETNMGYRFSLGFGVSFAI